MKSANTSDLKSDGQNDLAGSSPALEIYVFFAEFVMNVLTPSLRTKKMKIDKETLALSSDEQNVFGYFNDYSIDAKVENGKIVDVVLCDSDCFTIKPDVANSWKKQIQEWYDENCNNSRNLNN